MEAPGQLPSLPLTPLKPGPANVSITLRRQEKGEQAQTSTEKMKHCLIFSREIFYVTIDLR